MCVCNGVSRRGTGIVLSVLVTVLAVFRAEAFVKNANEMLATSYRADLAGAEVWTASSKSVDFDGTEKTLVESEVPYFLNAKPRPGLRDTLHVVHLTSVEDAIALCIGEFTPTGKVELSFAAVRNRWTPAHCTTYYRSVLYPGAAGDCAGIGATVLKEVKCIDSDNVFVAEAVLKNTGRLEREYEISLVPGRHFVRFAGSGGVTAARWAFDTVSMCKARKRECSVAVATSLGSFRRRVKIAPGGEYSFRYACAFSAASTEETAALASSRLSAEDPFADNERAFNGWFDAKVPRFESSDIGIEKMYFYRWFVVKRNIHDARRVIARHEYPRRAVYESPVGDWYNCVIGLPVPLQLQEMSWMRDPLPAREHLLNWRDRVKGYRMYIQYTAMAAWGMLSNHPDKEFAAAVSKVLADDALRRAGGDSAALPVQAGSWLTGAEYQPSFYQFTTPSWDYRNDEQFVGKGFKRAKLIRLDKAVYGIGGLVGASRIAAMAGDGKLASSCSKAAEAKLASLKAGHWNAGLGLFLSVDPASGAQTDKAACYDSFAPYMWNLVSDGEYDRAFDRLTDEKWFWGDFPVTTVQKTCPMYFGANAIPVQGSPTEFWRYGCSWNGPVWHYSNSLVAEAFGRAAMRSPSRRGKWLEFFGKWTRMHHAYGDVSLPRAAEHVRPDDGAICGSAWDYFHSSWIDPMIRYWCGISLSDDLRSFVFDPFTEDEFRISGVPLGGREFVFEQRRVNGAQMRSVYSMDGKLLSSGSGALTLAVQEAR